MSQDDISANVKICTKCQHKNKSDAVLCFKCGTLLPIRDTLPVSPDEIPDDKVIDMQHHMKTIQHQRLYAGALFLYVLENAQSTIIVDKQDMILGREDPGSRPTPGDLSRFDAYALGVSRNHAQITYEEGRYILQDLGSANGTWVNGHRLLPRIPYQLKNEDLIWLGKLVLTVYLAPVR
jgi:hypothetical protein